MSTLTRKQLACRVAQKTGQDKKECLAILNHALSSITDYLANGERVEVRKFGNLDTYTTPPKPAQNPKTGETVIMPQRRIVKFKPGNVMKRKVHRGTRDAGQAAPEIEKINCSGILKFEDISSNMDKTLNSTYLNKKPVCIDIRNCSTRIDYDQLYRVTSRIVQRAKSKNIPRIAYLVDSDLLYGLARVASAYATSANVEIQPFREEPEAVKWLKE